MKKYFLISSVAVVAMAFSSCATIFSGTSQTVNFSSEPQGAIVKIDGMQLCATPCSTKVKKTARQGVIFSKEGYEDKTVGLKGGFNGLVVGNILLGGIIGIAIDYATGAAWTYNNNSVHAQLIPVNEIK